MQAGKMPKIGPHVDGSRAEYLNMSLKELIANAYQVKGYQITCPPWLASTRFDIVARMPEGAGKDDAPKMLQKLLEERFKLKIRHETRELPVYILTVDKKGSKMPLHDPTDLKHEPIGGGPGGLSGENVTMNYFAFFLSRILDLNVIDRTQLPDHYDVKFNFVPDKVALGRAGGPEGGATPVVPEGPDIFTALREQLGLRLEKGKGPVDYLVIEHAEKPSDN